MLVEVRTGLLVAFYALVCAGFMRGNGGTDPFDGDNKVRKISPESKPN